MADAVSFDLTIENQGVSIAVAEFGGREALNALYEFAITVLSDGPHPALEGVVGKSAALRIRQAERIRLVHGMVRQCEHFDFGRSNHDYRLILAPAYWYADHNQEIRIFQHQSAASIIDDVLTGHDIDTARHRMQLTGDYPVREYCVQYRESDWAFVQRLMAEEGMFSYFVHAADHHELVVADRSSAYVDSALEVPFVAIANPGRKEAHITRVAHRQQLRPGPVTLVDYNFEKPTLSLMTTAGGGPAEQYDYPGGHVAPERGAALASSRVASLQRSALMLEGAGNVERFTPGTVFRLSSHSRDGSYALVEVVHRGGGARPSDASLEDGGPSYVNEWSAVDEERTYPALVATRKPTISGVQTAMVTGPSGEEVHTDEHGRIKVKFHWDRHGADDDNSSCWLRVSQSWAGAGFGAMFVPRVGQEVIVSFIEGDPDRPLVTGRVYHGTNVPPHPLPAEKAKSTLRSQSTKGGGGANELTFDDSKGDELMYLHAQKNLRAEVELDRTQTVGQHDSLTVAKRRAVSVGEDETHRVGGSRSLTVSAADTQTVTLARVVNVGGASTHSVGGAFIENIGATKQSTVVGASSERVGALKTLNVAGAMKETIRGNTTHVTGGERDVAVGGKYQLSVDENATIAVQKDAFEMVKGSKTITADKGYAVRVGKGTLTMNDDGTIELKGDDITIEGAGVIAVKSDRIEIESDGAVNVKAKGAVKVQGSNVDVN
ncbi:MAG: type VI secretion system tip protein TssI/VgrG [Myxococcota bacterium]